MLKKQYGFFNTLFRSSDIPQKPLTTDRAADIINECKNPDPETNKSETDYQKQEDRNALSGSVFAEGNQTIVCAAAALFLGFAAGFFTGKAKEKRSTCLLTAKQNIPAQKTYLTLGFRDVGEAEMWGRSFFLYELKI